MRLRQLGDVEIQRAAQPDGRGPTAAQARAHGGGGREDLEVIAMRKSFDALYLGCGWLAAIFLGGICVLMLSQAILREFGVLIRGADDLTAWFCAASAFLALAHTFKNGDLVRVGLLLVLLSILLTGGVWIAIALGSAAWAALHFFTGSPPDVNLVTSMWNSAASWNLAALPLFVLMGEILFRTSLSEDMFNGLAPWL